MILERIRSLVLMPLLAIVLALVIGAAVMILSSPLVRGELNVGLPIVAYSALAVGAFGSFEAWVTTIGNAAPLLLAGMAVGLGFKGGLFNIGAQGQFLVGALAAAAAGIAMNDASPWVAIPVALLAGMAGGLAYGFIPGFLKAFTGAHEVVTTIMLNYVAVFLIAYLISGPLRGSEVTFSRTDDIVAAALPPIIGRDGNLGILLAAASVPILWWVLYRSTLGFEIRTTGANPDAARYGGMHPRWLMVLTMSLCGMFAGLAGATDVLGQVGYMPASYATSIGFTAIAVALLGRAHPVGILFAALLFGAMNAGANLMEIRALIPKQMILVVQAIILLLLTAEVVVRRVFRIRAAGGGLSELATVTRSYGEQR